VEAPDPRVANPRFASFRSIEDLPVARPFPSVDPMLIVFRGGRRPVILSTVIVILSPIDRRAFSS
jgi:hypothetical protein